MNLETDSREPYDRYKASSFEAYNVKLPERYDTSLAVRFLRVSVMDDFVLDELDSEVASLGILDVGCATGRLLNRLAAAGARTLAGSDLAPRILEVARAKMMDRGVEADLRSADAEGSLPWSTDSFDVVTLTGVLHHFFRPRRALAEIRRVLRPGGRLIVCDACFFSPVREIFNLCLRVQPHEGDYHFYAVQQAGDLLTECRWDVVSCQRLGWWSYGVVGVNAREGGAAGKGANTVMTRNGRNLSH
ncbi:MAG: class I SAM-dependent methyltransferase [Candidatus Eisenbacteria bacterium]